MATHRITDHGATADGSTDNAPAIQAALDACDAAGGGTVEVPAGGVFLSGPLCLRSRTRLHLEAGAVLKCAPDPTPYLGETKQAGRWWITGTDLHDLQITGHGALDGSGVAFKGPEGPYAFEGRKGCPRILGLFGCRGVRIMDVTFRDSADWAIHPSGCDDLLIEGVSVYNGLKMPNCDGIDPDHCRNVRIRDCHIEAGDDGIVIKTRKEWNQYGPCENIVVENCTVVSTSCGIKIGTETHQDIRNVLIKGCVVYDSNRGIGIAHRDAGTVENILINDCVVRTRLFHDHWWGRGEPLYVTALPRGDAGADHEAGSGVLGPLRNVRFQNILCEGENSVFLMGSPVEPMAGILFENIDLTVVKRSQWPAGRYDVRPCPPSVLPHGAEAIPPLTDWGCLAERPMPGYYLEQAREVTLRHCRLRWDGGPGGDPRPEWDAALEARAIAGLVIDDFQGLAAHPNLPDRVVE